MTQAKQLGPGSGTAHVHPIHAHAANETHDCPEDSQSRSGSGQKQIDVDGRLAGRMGFEITERDRVEVTGVDLDVQQAINFGDPRVISALSDIARCHTERESTTLLEIPFEITKSGRVHIEMEALTEIIARARTLEVDQAGFTATPVTAPQNP